MKNTPPTYSPFWILTVVILTFAFQQAIIIKDKLKQRSQIEAMQVELQKVLPQALTIQKTIENLGQDLLAMTNQEARQIVADFKIASSGQPVNAK